MTAALAIAETVVDFPLAEILDPTIKNYRTNFRGIDELEASVRESGIRVPLVLRASPTDPGKHELAIGARRREAAKRAGLETVPVIIRELSDEEVHTERAIENLQRVDPDPVDEAEAFQRMTGLGWSVAQVAAKIGKPPRYVLERLQLCNLCPEGRQALEDGSLLVGAAIEVAKLASGLQAEALEEVAGSKAWRGGLATAADARECIENRVMLRLAEAPFKLDDATLVPAAGPCTTCTKRTGGQAELFADFATDRCTDGACHKSKVDALWQLRTKQAKAEGVEVLSKKAAVEALRSTGASYGNGPFVRLDEKVHLGSNKPKSLKAAFGTELPPITLARDEESGAPVELVPRKAVEKLLKTASAGGATGRGSQVDARAKAEREADRVKGELRRRTMAALVSETESQCAKGRPGKALLNLLVRGALEAVWTDITKNVADRRGLPMVDDGATSPKKGAKRQLPRLKPAERIERLLPELDEGQLLALLLELLFGRSAPGKWSDGADCYVDLCTELAVDPKGLEAVIKAERKAKAASKGKPASKLVHQFTIGGEGASLCGKAEPGEKTATNPKEVTCEGCRAKAKEAKAKGKSRPAAKAAKAPEPPAPSRPEHPAKSKPVHFIDPTGLSQTGLACGAEAADGKGVITEDASKVTCKTCRRTAGLDDAVDEPAPGDE